VRVRSGHPFQSQIDGKKFIGVRRYKEVKGETNPRLEGINGPDDEKRHDNVRNSI
jgi:hypothetical protein